MLTPKKDSVLAQSKFYLNQALNKGYASDKIKQSSLNVPKQAEKLKITYNYIIVTVS